jgi:hypothetical protein
MQKLQNLSLCSITAQAFSQFKRSLNFASISQNICLVCHLLQYHFFKLLTQRVMTEFSKKKYKKKNGKMSVLSKESLTLSCLSFPATASHRCQQELGCPTDHNCL